MISELSEGAQFIVTTFRSELLAHADSHFGVIFDARKVSSIRPIKESEAREFVEVSFVLYCLARFRLIATTGE